MQHLIHYGHKQIFWFLIFIYRYIPQRDTEDTHTPRLPSLHTAQSECTVDTVAHTVGRYRVISKHMTEVRVSRTASDLCAAHPVT